MSLDTAALATTFPSDSTYITTHGWAAIAGVAVLGFGTEPVIREIAEEILHRTSGNENAQVKAFRKLREGCLKASPLVGFPRSIHGLSVLRSFLNEKVPHIAQHLANDKSLREPVSLEERQRRGKAFFTKIYSQHTDRVLQNLNESSGGDLGEFAINCIYGDLVAETSILDAKETGLLEFVCCLCLGAANQTKGHMYGSHNLGNTGEEITAAVKVVRRIAQDLKITRWNDKAMDFLNRPEEKGW